VTTGRGPIGAGLAPARPARPIEASERIHIVGIAGAGASAAGLLAARAGAAVTGCDPGGPSPYTVALDAAGVPMSWGHDARHVTTEPRPTRLAVTKALTAIDPDHEELAAARAAGVPVEPWQQVVADAAAGRVLVAVAGTHGKSTTSGWLVHVLVHAGSDPTAFVGALLPSALVGGPPATARWGRGPHLVVEADEYAGNFDPYRPDHVVLTNVDWDHPDVFPDRAAVVGAFEAWLTRAADSVGAVTLSINVGDRGSIELLDRLRDPRIAIRPYLLGSEPLAPVDVPVLSGEVISAEPSGTVLALRHGDRELGAVHLTTAGRHNAADALAVVSGALGLGISLDAVIGTVVTFGGVGRRLELKGIARDVVVYDDYGHHPTAIRETLAAVRQRQPGRPVWAVYEPLTYHRTAALLDAFAEALSDADAIVIADIWAGRDPDLTITSADALAAAVRTRVPGRPVHAPGTVEDTAAFLARRVEPGDVVLVMGGGRSYRIAELLLEALGD
jgi:UDP-N-acetylmuramate--alanine ligase